MKPLSALEFASEGTVSLARIDRLRTSMPGKDSLIDELIDLFVADLPSRLGAIAQAIERADAPPLRCKPMRCAAARLTLAPAASTSCAGNSKR